MLYRRASSVYDTWMQSPFLLSPKRACWLSYLAIHLVWWRLSLMAEHLHCLMAREKEC
jgi:hypothetical protein